jgi:hypothetical protein
MFTGGISPPVDDWKKILDENNARARRLEEDYEGTCVQKKVSDIISQLHMIVY